ncbi:MAG: hypothetical protein NC251_11485 [Lachnoclostridium sp.]|nr:hypothetical protein [Lachnospira sp.]MCM1249039.1 hypothetical protein [Lachnoclostridium sp.]MCM1535639.1 hypothetical protein [Clostridium sp.]
MDINGMSEEGFGMYGAAAFPYGMGSAVALNDRILDESQGMNGLTETEREHLIMQYRDARSDKERQKIIDERAPGGNPYALFERDEID